MALEITVNHPNVKTHNANYLIWKGDVDLDELGDVIFIGNYIITGDIKGEASIECDGRLIVERSIDIGGDLIVEEGADINGDLLCGSSVESNADIHVNGRAEGLTIVSEGNLNVGESVDVDELYVKNNAKIGGDLNCKKFEYGGVAEILGERNVDEETIEALESILDAGNPSSDEDAETGVRLKG